MTTVAERKPSPAVARFFGAPRPIRVAFGLLERFAPAVGARWAERIWFTLPRTRTGSPDLAGDPFSLAVGGRAVTGTTWGEGPVVYLVHGWGGHTGDLAAFVPALVARGLRAVAFDAPSHGASAPGAFGPRSSSLPEFVDALAAVIEAQGAAHAIVAHSMGATAAATVLRDGTPAGRLVMLAPMASPASYARHFAVALGFGDRTYLDLVARVGRRIGTPLHHFDVPAYGRVPGMPPALIVHDWQDSFMPVANATAIARAWPGSRLHLTTGLGHRRLLRDPEVVAEVVDFVDTGSHRSGASPPRRPKIASIMKLTS
jgi:pimeloyl-ACP methyl ester carboxylesterase